MNGIISLILICIITGVLMLMRYLLGMELMIVSGFSMVILLLLEIKYKKP